MQCIRFTESIERESRILVEVLLARYIQYRSETVDKRDRKVIWGWIQIHSTVGCPAVVLNLELDRCERSRSCSQLEATIAIVSSHTAEAWAVAQLFASNGCLRNELSIDNGLPNIALKVET